MPLLREVNNLTPEEAAKKLHYLQVKLWHEQYQVNWFIRDVRSDIYLRNEIIAFWEGRISEIHGWTDIAGQIVGAIVQPIRDALTWFWDNIVVPGLKAALSAGQWFYEAIRGAVSHIWNRITEVYNYLSSVIHTAISAVQSTLTDVWNYLVEKVSGTLEAITKGLAAIPQAIASAFQSAISWIGQLIAGIGQAIMNFFTWLNQTVVQPIVKGLEWLFNWIGVAVKSFWQMLIGWFSSVSRRIQQGQWTAALEIAVPFVSGGLGINAILSVAGVKILGTGIEVGELGHYLNRLLNPELLTTAILGTIIYTSIRRPLEQCFNRMFRTALPPQEDLEAMYRRGLIKDGEYRDFLARMGYPDNVIDGYLDLANVIPGISDLIRFAVREAYPVEGPEAQLAEMKKWAAKQGLSEYWADRYWIAHWQLPSFENLREAFWRGIIDEEDFKKFVLKHDYRPDPWPGHKKADQQIMFELSYRLPGAIEQRWMLRWGLIDKETLIDLTRKRGMHPDWVQSVAEGIWRQMLTDERTRLLTQLRYQYRDGEISRETLAAKLKELYYSQAEIDLILQAADIEREREVKSQSLIEWRNATRADFSRAFKMGLITEDAYREALKQLRYPPDIIDMLVAIDKELIEVAKQREKQRLEAELRRQTRQLTRTDLSRAFKLGVITEEQYRERLKTLGYQDAEIDTIISIDKTLIQAEQEREQLRKKEQEAVEAARLTADEKNSVKTALLYLFTHGMLPETALRERLKALGWTQDEIDLIVEAGQLKQYYTLTDQRIDAAVAEYRYGKISLEELGKKLTELGLSDAFVQNILLYEKSRTKTPVQSTPEEEVRAMGCSIAIRRYREGITTPAELEQELRLLGYSQAEIERYKIMAELERDYNMVMEALSAMRYAYRKGKISESKFMELAAQIGITREAALTYLSLEKLKLGLGTEEMAS